MRALAEEGRLYMQVYRHESELFDCLKEQGYSNENIDNNTNQELFVENTRVNALHAYCEHVKRAITGREKSRINFLVRHFFAVSDSPKSFSVRGYANVHEPFKVDFHEHTAVFKELRDSKRIKWLYDVGRSGGFIKSEVGGCDFTVHFEDCDYGLSFRDFSGTVERDVNGVVYISDYKSFMDLYLSTLNIFEWVYLYLVGVSG